LIAKNILTEAHREYQRKDFFLKEKFSLTSPRVALKRSDVKKGDENILKNMDAFLTELRKFLTRVCNSD
jgi:hypothetical protein